MATGSYRQHVCDIWIFPVWDAISSLPTAASHLLQIPFSSGDTPTSDLRHMVTWRKFLYDATSRRELHRLPQVPTAVRLSWNWEDSSGQAPGHTLIEVEYCVTVCTLLGLLPTNSREEFYPDLQAHTIHALFNIPVAADKQYAVNYNIGKYDAIIIDEASMVADDTFEMINNTLEKQVHRPLVIIAGDECQQLPLQTINGRTIQTTSILKNCRLRKVCQIHSLYQQFRCTDKPYMDFLQYIRYSRPQQYVVDNFQRPLLLFEQSDNGLRHMAHCSRRARRHLSNSLPCRCKSCQQHCDCPHLPGENTGVDDTPGEWCPRLSPFSRHARRCNSKSRQTYWCGQRPARHNSKQSEQHPPLEVSKREDDVHLPCHHHHWRRAQYIEYALNPAYCMTICKTQGTNIKRLIVWFDCPTVPTCTGYVALSRVRKSEDIKILTPMVADQLTPALT